MRVGQQRDGTACRLDGGALAKAEDRCAGFRRASETALGQRPEEISGEYEIGRRQIASRLDEGLGPTDLRWAVAAEIRREGPPVEGGGHGRENRDQQAPEREERADRGSFGISHRG
ncbi:hypothetical protein [Methylobacterium mesophilicum]|uniref:hypothetical protein n=1 Tax=Methylobacterium mesophilicum TaxID=39956 RepID=UPI002F350B74